MLFTCESCGIENRVPVDKLARHPKCGRCKAMLAPPNRPLAMNDEAEFNAFVRDAPWPVLVDFWAAWCGPCRAVAPELERLAAARAGQVLIAKVDTERVPSLAQRFAIRSIPTIVRFDRGQETQRVSGAMRADQLAAAFAL